MPGLAEIVLLIWDLLFCLEELFICHLGQKVGAGCNLQSISLPVRKSYQEASAPPLRVF